MGPKCLRVATRNKLVPNRRISGPCPRAPTRSRLPTASSSPSIGWPMKTDSKPPATTSPLLHPCPSTSSRCSQTLRPLEFCKSFDNISPVYYRMYITSQQYFRFTFRNLKFDDKIRKYKNVYPNRDLLRYTVLFVDWLAGMCKEGHQWWGVLKLVGQKFISRKTLPSWTPLGLEIKMIKAFFKWITRFPPIFKKIRRIEQKLLQKSVLNFYLASQDVLLDG